MDNLKPVMPKEHGIWVWVLLPTIAGGFTTLGDTRLFWPFFFAVLFWFLAFTPSRTIYKNSRKKMKQSRRSVVSCFIYSFCGLIFTVWSLLDEINLLPFYLFMALIFYFGIKASHAGFHRNFSFELFGITALSLLSLASSFVVTGQIGRADMAVWAFVFIFLMERNLETRNIARYMVVRQAGEATEDDAKLIAKINIFISLFAILCASVALDIFQIKKVFMTLFLPGFLLTAIFYFYPPPTLKRVGWSELLLAILFGSFMIYLSRNFY